MRKVIQVATSQSKSDTGGLTFDLYALCDDGSIWQFQQKRWHRDPATNEVVIDQPETWTRFVDVPQPEITCDVIIGTDTLK